MAATYINIGEWRMSEKDLPLLDVRTPAEYAHAHIPSAISFPIFSDEERVRIGTAYKKQSREIAIKIGLEYFGPRMSSIISAAEKICEGRDKKLVLQCWRGGMRSAAMAWLLDFYGFEVLVITGGYKAYRNAAIAVFADAHQFKILGGFTGTGKTVLLRQLAATGSASIDLEKIACHKGSAFGHTEIPQPSQEMFENLLAEALIANDKKLCWLEDESQRIGNLKIPDALWATMRAAPVYFVDIPFEQRLRHIVEEYGKLQVDEIVAATERIAKRLGPQHAKQAIVFVKEGSIEDCFSILLKYYDIHYGRGLSKRQQDVSILKIPFRVFEVDKIVQALKTAPDEGRR